MGEKKELKDRLRQAMDYKGMNATELSDKTGITKAAMSYYLNGRSEPKTDRLYLIAKALDVSEAWLLGYDVPIDRTEDQKENDELAEVAERIKKDREFRRLIVQISRLNPQQVDGIKNLLSVFDLQGRES